MRLMERKHTRLIRVTNYCDTFIGGSDIPHQFILHRIGILTERKIINPAESDNWTGDSQFIYEYMPTPSHRARVLAK
jgi:hypothetical protein